MQSTQPPTKQEENLAHYKQVLRNLVDMANDMAQSIHKQHLHQTEAASAALPPQNTPAPGFAQDLTIPFTRIARTIRRTVLLAEHLEKTPTQNHRAAARKRILREVEDVIHRNATPKQVESLTRELRDRLDAPDLEEDIDLRPLDDIIDDICRDLRVATPYANNWKRRTPQEVETLRQQANTIPETWLTPPNRPTHPPPPRRPRKPTLPPIHDTPASILAEFTRIRRNTA